MMIKTDEDVIDMLNDLANTRELEIYFVHHVPTLELLWNGHIPSPPELETRGGLVITGVETGLPLERLELPKKKKKKESQTKKWKETCNYRKAGFVDSDYDIAEETVAEQQIDSHLFLINLNIGVHFIST
ncbi:hypothetical protein Adt_04178 [Abeliophyllum distichum]|uniref:Uncharacterized protein n=1 Tax=Abeliophyllum distichum TaxID=126358 RepID=A0ABD1W3Z3_9LAMI